MIPLIPIIACAIGGILIAGASSGDDDDSFKGTDDFVARMAAGRERKRREREAQERRRRARLKEAEGDLSRARCRHSRRISSAKATAARSKANLDELVAVERDLDELLK